MTYEILFRTMHMHGADGDAEVWTRQTAPVAIFAKKPMRWHHYQAWY